MSTTLVTGATGFAGSHLLDHLLQHDAQDIVAWGRPSGRSIPWGGSQRITWRAVDVTDRQAVERALDTTAPAVVYHCAGVAAVQSASNDSARALRVNAFGTHVLLTELARRGFEGPVLVTGSALVYRASADPLTESAPIAPSTPYGVSKLAQEMIALDTPQVHVILARPFNHAGPRQGDDFVTSSFARQIAEAEAGLRAPVLRVGNLDAQRDVTDVRDTVRAYRLLVEHGKPRTPYNVCRGEAYRVGDLLDWMVQRARVGITVELDPARLRPSDNPVVLGSAAKLQADCGWTPRIPIQQTLDDLLDYWRQAVSPSPGPRR